MLDVGDCDCDDGRECCGNGDDVVLRAGSLCEVRERRGGGKDGRDRVGAKSGGFLAKGGDGREYDQEDGADGDPCNRHTFCDRMPKPDNNLVGCRLQR